MAEGCTNTGLKEFKYDLTGTTTASGALEIPSALRSVGLTCHYYGNARYGLIYRRDAQYLTCLNNAFEPEVNQEITVRLYYVSYNALI